MVGLNRRRTHACHALSRAGMLLALLGLTVVGVENVSSGHAHLSGEQAAFHRHLHAGPHEHPGAQPGHPAHHESDDEAPARDDRPPRRTATVSAAPMLFQPAAAVVLAAPLADSTPVLLAPTLPRRVRSVTLLIPPRAPPALPLSRPLI